MPRMRSHYPNFNNAIYFIIITIDYVYNYNFIINTLPSFETVIAFAIFDTSLLCFVDVF